MYRLGNNIPDVEAAWAALTPEASEELTLAMADVCQDPWGRTRPRDREDDKDVRRILRLRHTVVALLIMDAPPIRRVYVRSIDYLG